MRELRNQTAGLLRRIEAGEEILVTVHGKPAAQLVPVRHRRRRWVSRAELEQRLARGQADSGLRRDLARLVEETTEDLGPIR